MVTYPSSAAKAGSQVQEALKERRAVKRAVKLRKPPHLHQTLGREISSSGDSIPESDPGLGVTLLRKHGPKIFPDGSLHDSEVQSRLAVKAFGECPIQGIDLVLPCSVIPQNCILRKAFVNLPLPLLLPQVDGRILLHTFLPILADGLFSGSDRSCFLDLVPPTNGPGGTTVARNLNLNLGTPQGEDGHHEEEEKHMEQQNMGVGGGGTPAQRNFFMPYVRSTAGVHTHITIPAHVYNDMMDNQARMQTWITEMMTKDQTRYKTPSPPPSMNQEGMEEDKNTLITRGELACILKGKGELTEPAWEINLPFGYHLLAKLYPKGYQPPVFRKFDGTGSAKEH
ncbi:hypothetical protein PIB30_077613 [Stylosanthes scabra]|uniref:Uncharacterized protein n=1 Tax=Stylosanthes scabra TaxID=79078 RepID=A0ABU6SQR3_9FABA|nr:hypothetical protein [Stylosanthes scabra]